MICVGNICPAKYDMKDISSVNLVNDAIKGTYEASKQGTVIAFENREKLVEM